MSKPQGWPELPEPLPSPVVDNHAHLDIGIRGGELIAVEDAITRAASVGVTRLVQVGCDVSSSRWAAATAAAHPSIVAAVAIHPNEAARMDDAELDDALAEIDRLAQLPDVRAVGETGLDYFRTAQDGRPRQHRSFREHIAIAKRHSRTLVIHDRDSHDDISSVLDEVGAPDRWVMHCFSGDVEFAQQCLERGAYLSFAGTVTFKNAPGLRVALAAAPADRILVETDAPFLTPEPYRGRPNASYLVPHTVRLMAQVRQVGLDVLCRDLDDNTDRAFGGPWPEAPI